MDGSEVQRRAEGSLVKSGFSTMTALVAVATTTGLARQNSSSGGDGWSRVETRHGARGGSCARGLGIPGPRWWRAEQKQGSGEVAAIHTERWWQGHGALAAVKSGRAKAKDMALGPLAQPVTRTCPD